MHFSQKTQTIHSNVVIHLSLVIIFEMMKDDVLMEIKNTYKVDIQKVTKKDKIYTCRLKGVQTKGA